MTKRHFWSQKVGLLNNRVQLADSESSKKINHKLLQSLMGQLEEGYQNRRHLQNKKSKKSEVSEPWDLW